MGGFFSMFSSTPAVAPVATSKPPPLAPIRIPPNKNNTNNEYVNVNEYENEYESENENINQEGGKRHKNKSRKNKKTKKSKKSRKSRK